MILSAIHNDVHLQRVATSVVYDMILSAIHNHRYFPKFSTYVVYDMILSAIHNFHVTAGKIPSVV